MSKLTFVLFESASGYGLFELVALDEIGTKAKDVQKTISDLARFSKVMKLKAFQPFTSTAGALEEINAVSEGIMTDNLKDFLTRNLPKSGKEGKKSKFALGMIDAKLANAIQEGTGLKCVCDEIVGEVLRGVRNHLTHFIKGLSDMDLNRSQLSLAHSYSRAKVKFNVNKVDNMIIQAISLLDILDRDINTFIMRVKEWYAWHFPELVKLVTDNYMFHQNLPAHHEQKDIHRRKGFRAHGDCGIRGPGQGRPASFQALDGPGHLGLRPPQHREVR